MNVTLTPAGAGELRFFIRADGKHAGGITVHSLSEDGFSYGIAIAPQMRRRGIARAALTRLFAGLAMLGYTQCSVQVREDNTASLALHVSLGFQEKERHEGIVTMTVNLQE